MAPVITFKAFVVLLVAAIFAAAASAQDFNLSPSPAPAPAPDVGAAGSVSSSVALISASLVLSMLAILKN